MKFQGRKRNNNQCEKMLPEAMLRERIDRLSNECAERKEKEHCHREGREVVSGKTPLRKKKTLGSQSGPEHQRPLKERTEEADKEACIKKGRRGNCP